MNIKSLNPLNTLKGSLIISLIGILLLLLISFNLEPKTIEINEIKETILDKTVIIKGTIININSYKDSDFQILSIKDKTGKIDITINKILDLKINQTIIVKGRVQEYKNSLQVQADKIILK